MRMMKRGRIWSGVKRRKGRRGGEDQGNRAEVRMNLTHLQCSAVRQKKDRGTKRKGGGGKGDGWRLTTGGEDGGIDRDKGVRK